MMLPGGAAITLIRRLIAKNGWGYEPNVVKETSDVELEKPRNPYDDVAIIVQAISYCLLFLDVSNGFIFLFGSLSQTTYFKIS